jgi:hypothetical protein
MRYDCALMSSYKTMIKVGIMMNINGRDRTNGRDSKLGLRAGRGKGKTHVLFSQAADNFISILQVSSVVSVSFSTGLIEKATVRVARQLCALAMSVRSLAPERAPITL